MDCNFLVLKRRMQLFYSFIFLRFLSMLSFIVFSKHICLYIVNLKRIGYRAGMPEWSKGPDSSKICFLTKIQDFW